MGDCVGETDRTAFGASEDDSLWDRDAEFIVGGPKPWRANRLCRVLWFAFCEAEHFREAHGVSIEPRWHGRLEAAVPLA
jgi:hypothetical protein